MKSVFRGVLFYSCLSTMAPSAEAAAIVNMNGDLVTYLNAIPIPGAGTQSFSPPDSASMAQWRPVVDALFGGQYQKAANLADPLGYDVVAFNDTGRGRTYYALVERKNPQGLPLRGLGTYVYNPAACRNLSFHAPHAGGDENTRQEAATLFAELNATALLIAGTHRCANAQVSSCDGSTAACGDGQFHISDVAHYTQNYFEPAHEEILKTIPNIITVAIHGEGEHTPNAIISNGTCLTYPAPSAATLLAAAYSQLLHNLGGGLSAGSCNQGQASTSLCAETDVQGRYANNSLSLCNCSTATKSACSSTLGCARNVTFPERFVHLEQDCVLRQVSGCAAPAGVDFTLAVKAFASVFPCNPTISAVVHGASFRTDPLSPGSLFSLFGQGLGSLAAPGATAAFSLGGLKAQICGVPARLIFNSGQGQVNGIVPVEVAGQTNCQITATPDGFTIPSVATSAPVEIVPQDLGIFTYAASSTLTVPIITDANYQLIGPPQPGFVQARKGNAVVLWTTGGGLTTPPVPDSQSPPSPAAVMQIVPAVHIAGQPATVLFAGLSPGLPGVYQINVQIPANTPSGKVTLTIASGIGDSNYDLWVQ
jgi:uncharacterized protein (TIGR03437 family)